MKNLTMTVAGMAATGKSAVAELVAACLRDCGVSVDLVDEPGVPARGPERAMQVVKAIAPDLQVRICTEQERKGWNPGDDSTLSQDQQDCIKLLEFTLAEARKGTFHAMAIIGVTAQGFGSQIVGNNVPATYMGLAMALRELEDKFKPAPAPVQRQRPSIIRPGMTHNGS